MVDGGWGRTAVAHRNAFLEEFRGVDVESLSPDQLGDGLKCLRSTSDLVELESARWMAAFDRNQAFIELGEHSAIDWLKNNTHISAASADSQLTLARQLDSMEPTVEAVEQGDISFEHALQIARQLEDLPDKAQAELLEAATQQDPRELRKLGDAIRHREDPDGFSRSAYRQHQKRRLRLFDLRDGMLGIEGALPAPEGMKFRPCMESLIGIPAKGDERTPAQRNADAFIELNARAIGSGKLPRQAGRRPQLTVLVQSMAGEDVAAQLEGVGPISLGTRARLRGEDHVERRQLVDGKGVTLNFGRGRRCHSEAQREDISTHYSTCQGGNCDVPIRDCEIHHPVAVAEGGETDKYGVPLCRRKHHPQVTEGGYELVPRQGGGFDLVRLSPAKSGECPAQPGEGGGVEFRPDRWRQGRNRGDP